VRRVAKSINQSFKVLVFEGIRGIRQVRGLDGQSRGGGEGGGCFDLFQSPAAAHKQQMVREGVATPCVPEEPCVSREGVVSVVRAGRSVDEWDVLTGRPPFLVTHLFWVVGKVTWLNGKGKE
jgi:hypothetical protein